MSHMLVLCHKLEFLGALQVDPWLKTPEHVSSVSSERGPFNSALPAGSIPSFPVCSSAGTTSFPPRITTGPSRACERGPASLPFSGPSSPSAPRSAGSLDSTHGPRQQLRLGAGGSPVRHLGEPTPLLACTAHVLIPREVGSSAM